MALLGIEKALFEIEKRKCIGCVRSIFPIRSTDL